MQKITFSDSEVESLIRKLTEEEKFCLDSFLITGNRGLAYGLSRKRESKAVTKQTFNTSVYKWFKSDEVRAYIQKRNNDIINGNFIISNRNNPETFEEANKALSKVNFTIDENGEEVLKDGSSFSLQERQKFVNSYKRLWENTNDIKLKADFGMKYANLMGWLKGEQEVSEDNRVVFYLPLKCSKCPKNK